MPFINIGDINLFYEASSPNFQTPLVFIHGWLASSEFWTLQVDHFKEKRPFILFDLRGHGNSDKPSGEYSISQFSNDLFVVLQKLEKDKIILVGHSMGGMTALQFALDHPDLVEKLILIDTPPKGIYSVKSRIFFILAPLALSVAFKPFLKSYIASVFHKGFSKTLLEEFQSAGLKNPKHVVKSSLSAIKNFNFDSYFANIQPPTLIIHGEAQETPISLVESMQTQIPDAKLIIIENAAHVTPIETPNQIWDAIEEFLDSRI